MYQLKDRVVKISSRSGSGTRFIEPPARGEVIRLTPPASHLTDTDDYPYILVNFDRHYEQSFSGGNEWCYQSELVRADAYDKFVKEYGRAPTLDDVTGSDNGVQLLELYPEGAFSAIPGHPVGEIIGDGPMPDFTPIGVERRMRESLRAAEISSIQRDAEPTVLSDSQVRKMMPVGTVATEYFPLGDRGRAAVSWVGNEKHNPGEHLHWSRGKSDDHENALLRHLQDMKAPGADGWDTYELPDGRVYQVRHASAASWRASAIAQLDAESVGGQVIRRLK